MNQKVKQTKLKKKSKKLVKSREPAYLHKVITKPDKTSKFRNKAGLKFYFIVIILIAFFSFINWYLLKNYFIYVKNSQGDVIVYIAGKPFLTTKSTFINLNKIIQYLKSKYKIKTLKGSQEKLRIMIAFREWLKENSALEKAVSKRRWQSLLMEVIKE